jgi:hypothetical protein
MLIKKNNNKGERTMTTKKYYGISKLFDSISLNFEIAKSVLYGSFVHDVAFRKFINSNLNTHPDDVCNHLLKNHQYFMIDFYRNQKNKERA